MIEVQIENKSQLWEWLEINHDRPASVRLITWKAAHRNKYVGRDDVLDALIAYGWIDGRRFVVDDDRTAQLISPRKQQAWSQSYKDRVERLRTEDLMRPAGEHAVQDGLASGLWDYFADVDALIVPEDMRHSIDLEKWEALAPSYQRNVLRWIKLAKTDATRTKRIATVTQATASGQKIPQM